MIFELAKSIQSYPHIAIIISCTIGLISICLYLAVSIGYKKNEEGIYLNWFDKLPLEIIGIGIITVLLILIAMLSEMQYSVYYRYELIICYIITLLLAYAFLAIRS